MKKIIKWILISFVAFIALGIVVGSSSDNSKKETISKIAIIQEGDFAGYNYVIIRGEDGPFIINFIPFLPLNDILMLTMMSKTTEGIAGERFDVLNPELVERNGIKLIKFSGAKGNHFFNIIKQKTDEVIREDGKEFIGHAGEIHTFIYWIE